jgi:hypothetical protein
MHCMPRSPFFPGARSHRPALTCTSCRTDSFRLWDQIWNSLYCRMDAPQCDSSDMATVQSLDLFCSRCKGHRHGHGYGPGHDHWDLVA